MQFQDLINTRRSIRTYTAQPLHVDQIRAILEAARQAPSAGNLQSYEVYAVTKVVHRAALAQATDGQAFLAEAPLVLVFCANPARNAERYGTRGASLYAPQDATIACTFAMLAAVDLGLACVWVGSFDEDEVAAAIGAATGLRPVAMLPIGYPAEQPEPRARRALAELVHAPEPDAPSA
jgi:nitroreductase